MRFKNDGPVTLYILVDTTTGEVIGTYTNLRVARSSRKRFYNLLSSCVIFTYDQRGTR